jgi:hypothetical protein
MKCLTSLERGSPQCKAWTEARRATAMEFASTLEARSWSWTPSSKSVKSTYLSVRTSGNGKKFDFCSPDSPAYSSHSFLLPLNFC